MKLDWSVREMQQSDVDTVGALYRQMYEEQTTFGMVMTFNGSEIEDMLHAQLKSKLFIQLVAESSQGLLGFGIGGMMRFPKKYFLQKAETPFLGFIHDVYLTPEARGHGAAGVLVEALEQRLAAQGIRYVELHVLSGNEPGQQFWQTKGYRDVVQVMYKLL